MTLLPLPLLAFILILGLAMGFVLDEFWSWLSAGVAEWHSIRPGRRIPATVGRMQGSSPCRQHSAKFAVTLTTENGLGPTNTIVLEPEVIEALLRYREWAKQRASEIAANQPQEKL